MDETFKLVPGPASLAPEQEAEARRFAQERIEAHLSTEPVDEQEAEAYLRQAYEGANLAPPARFHWVDSPIQALETLMPPRLGGIQWEHLLDRVAASLWAGVRDSVKASVAANLRANVEVNIVRVDPSIWGIAGIEREFVGDNVLSRIGESIGAGVRANVANWAMDTAGARVWDSVRDSVCAYHEASWLIFYRFFDVYLAPNKLHALACFNELVSGYWLGRKVALLVRRPRVLARDAQGRLHSATGKSVEYDDGWGFYTWHGVRVPEKVITHPEALTRRDFLNEPNVEVRRVIQERMGQRFVPECGRLLDEGPRGRLYEVRLLDDDPEDTAWENANPERRARYVEVQDASTPRQYFLRVPPWIKTAAQGVAWTFGMSAKDYQPSKEA